MTFFTMDNDAKCACRNSFQGECKILNGKHKCCCDIRNPLECKHQRNKHICVCGMFDNNNECRANKHKCICFIFKVGPLQCKAMTEHKCVCDIFDGKGNDQIESCLADRHNCVCKLINPEKCAHYNQNMAFHECCCNQFGSNRCIAFDH